MCPVVLQPAIIRAAPLPAALRRQRVTTAAANLMIRSPKDAKMALVPEDLIGTAASVWPGVIQAAVIITILQT